MMITKSSLLITCILALPFSGLALAADANKEQHEHKHVFAKDISDLHAVLAPAWHAPIGKTRLQEACAKAPTLAELTENIRSADTKVLQAAIAKLQDNCQNNPDQVDAAFSAVHDAFHQIADH